MIRARTVRSVEPTLAASIEPRVSPATMGVADAAAYIGISKATLYTWRTRRPGFGPRAVKAGGALRYRQADLDAWIEERAEALDACTASGEGNTDASGPTAPGPATRSMSRRSHPRYVYSRRSAER